MSDPDIAFPVRYDEREHVLRDAAGFLFLAMYSMDTPSIGRFIADAMNEKHRREKFKTSEDDHLPIVDGDYLTCSHADFERKCRVSLRDELEKPLTDNGLITVLCESVRLSREHVKAMTTPTKQKDEAKKI